MRKLKNAKRNNKPNASVAQSVEQRIRNAQVVSSSLTRSSSKNPVVVVTTGFYAKPARNSKNR